MRKTTILGVILIGLALFVGGTMAFGRSEQDSQLRLPGPPDRKQWVPFSAAITKIAPNGRHWVGRYYRRSDGSTRFDTGFTWEKIERISINNIAQTTNYKWDPTKGWSSQPMDLPPAGWHPGTPSARFISTLKASANIEGFDVYAKDHGKYVQFMAPQLDMFVVKLQWKECSTGVPVCGTWYSNIKVAEPPSDLFEVPSDQPVVKLSQPGGIYKVQ